MDDSLRTKNKWPRILSLFLLDNESNKTDKGRLEHEAQTDEVLKKYSLDVSLKRIIRQNSDALAINIHDADVFIIFPYTLQRFPSLIYLAEAKKSVIIVSEKRTLEYALETYDYLADHQNVRLTFGLTELRAHIEALQKAKWLDEFKVCVFDAGKWTLDGIAWQRNPLFQGKLHVQTVDAQELLETCEEVDKDMAGMLAKKWMKESKVREASFEDVARVARVYLAMKTIMKNMNANAAYVLWCGQFTKQLHAKMCFALAKLADDNIPVGCWRGGNLLPMLILHKVSRSPVFTSEARSLHGNVITLRHCFAPSSMTLGKYTLRRWRNMKGTVTGYVELPKGGITLANCGIGDRMAVTKGNVLDCKDLGGQNCRMTIRVQVEDEEYVHKLVGREFAMVYGDYQKEAKKLAASLGMKVV